MKKTLGIIQFLFLIVTVTAATANADVKIKKRTTVSGQTSESTTFIKGKRQRSENGSPLVSITQCDLQRDLQISNDARTYTVSPFNQPSEPANKPGQTTTEPLTKGGTVTTTITNKDTGERKQMFGYAARHIISTIETESSPDACTPMKSKMETDGWYIDATFALACDTQRYAGYRPAPRNGGCQDKYQTKQIGAAKMGYAVVQKMTMFDESGKPTMTMLDEVTEISNTNLDAALFDVPAGYTEVKDATALYSNAAQMSNIAQMQCDSESAMQSANVGNNASGDVGYNAGLGANAHNLAKGNNSPAAEVGAKKTGVVRLGLATVKTGAVGDGMNATDLSAAIQNTLSEYLKSPNIEIVLLEAKLSSAIDAEAKQKECDYVIYAQVSHKKGGGGFGFGKMLGQVVSQTGIGHTGSTIGNVAGQVATQSIVAATLTQNVKAKDEITLDIKLQNGANAVLTKQFKAKAKGNGDDIITPVVQQAAEAIVGAAAKS